jgi:hypothetical protein
MTIEQMFRDLHKLSEQTSGQKPVLTKSKKLK